MIPIELIHPAYERDVWFKLENIMIKTHDNDHIEVSQTSLIFSKLF